MVPNFFIRLFLIVLAYYTLYNHMTKQTMRS